MDNLEPITRNEMFLNGDDLEPITREEMILAGADLEPITRHEWFLKKYRGGGGGGGYDLVNVPNLPADIASFNDGTDLPMASLKVAVTPYQDLSHGDPSPENICPIIGWDEAVVTVVSEQLFNEEYPNIDSTLRKITLDVGEGSFTMLSDIPVFINGGVNVANIFLQTGKGESTASSDVDGVWKNHPVTVNSTDGKVTIKYRIFIGNTAYDPRNFNVILCKTATTYTIDLNGTRYGGTLDATDGTFLDMIDHIASYNGEALPSTWISDRDVYAEGTTPTIGAEVVYTRATPITVQLAPTQVKSLEGTNNIFANCGQITEGKYFKKA